MMKPLFRGTGVALITPFDRHQQVAFDKLEKMVEHVIAGGVDYIVALGTTGEAVTLTHQECRSVYDCIIQTTAKRVPLVAGRFGGNDTTALVQRLRTTNLNGFDAILSSSPSYNKPTQEGIFQHYMKVAQASPLPIILYNVPSRTASNIEAKTIVRLAHADEKFIAVKEASGDMQQVCSILKHRPQDFLVLSGDDPTTLPLLGCGGDGGISVIANAYPQAWTTMVRAALAGDFATAQDINRALWDIHPLLYVEGNPVGIKAACETLGLCHKQVRLPLVELSSEEHFLLKSEMETFQRFYSQYPKNGVKLK